MKPLLKWVGGKTQILQAVLDEFPRVMNNYYEPFVGGGSVLLGLLTSDIEVRESIYVSDVNPTLVNFYTVVKTQPEQLIVCTKVLSTEYAASENREEFYYKIRDLFNSMTKVGPEHAATFLFLNRMCFRGVYREGPRGFNVPFGHYKQIDICKEEEIRNVSKLIQRVHFTCEGFETAVPKAVGGDFIYLDPPYVPETLTSFVGYVTGGFDSLKHEALFQLVKDTPATIVMSNSNVPIVCDSFPPPFETKKIVVRRAIHSKDPSAKTTEVLITNKSMRPTS
jgi:DNA adenine methylase